MCENSNREIRYKNRRAGIVFAPMNSSLCYYWFYLFAFISFIIFYWLFILLLFLSYLLRGCLIQCGLTLLKFLSIPPFLFFEMKIKIKINIFIIWLRGGILREKFYFFFGIWFGLVQKIPKWNFNFKRRISKKIKNLKMKF